MPLISIIIPVYNGERTIKKTINSVLNQTISDLEIIIINDGSNDSTLDVISGILDPRIQVFSYSNSGVSVSRNRGVAKATSQYLTFLDADDLWTPNKLEEQLKALQSNPQAAVAYSWTDWIDESDNFLRPGGHIIANGHVLEQLFLRDFVESGSNPLIRRHALANVGGFEQSVSPVEDWDMWLRLAASYEFVTVPSVQILYRIAPNSASFNVKKMEAGSLKVIERAIAQSPELLQPLKREVLGNRYKYLTLKAIEGTPEAWKGLTAAQFLWQAIVNDPTWLRRTQLMSIVLFKILTATLLPPQLRKQLLGVVKQHYGRNTH